MPAVSAAPKRRRGRLSVHADLRLDDSLAANQNHPVAQTAPETDAASRFRLIATILARLAGASLKARRHPFGLFATLPTGMINAAMNLPFNVLRHQCHVTPRFDE